MALMAYTLTYSFFDTPGQSLTPHYVDATGAVGAAVPSSGSFEKNGWYGFTLNVADAFQGFVAFLDSSNNCIAMFACNPQEGENLDEKTSLLNIKGPGGIRFPVTVQDTSNNPVPGAQVWLTSDRAGDNLVAGTLVTDSTGTAIFEVPPGTYFLWRLHSKYTIPNPKTVTVS
jgi:hypothetical protein